MKRRIVSRWAVLIAMLVGLLAPTLSMTAAMAASPSTGTMRAEAALGQVTSLLAQGDDDKKLPEETPTPEDETPTPRDTTSRRSTSASEDMAGVLGGSRVDFEDEFGTPADDRDADDFAVGEIYEDIRGFDTVQVYWSEDDVALHIVLNASREWTETRALSQAESFLPDDVQLDQNPEELDGGELLYLGSSDALAGVTDRATYRDHEVGGRPGDLRVILVPGDDDTFATVDIAIGTGDEFQGTSSGRTTTTTTRKTPEPTEETRTTSRKTPEPTAKSRTSGRNSTSPDAYLSDVRDVVDQRQADLDRFYEIIGLGSSATDADFEELTNIVASWLEVPEIDAPAGFEAIDEAFTAMNNDFMGAALSFVTWASDPKANASALDDMSSYLKSAQANLKDVDALLTDEGA